MSTNVPRRGETETADDDLEPGAYLEGYEEPVIVKTRLRTDGVYHDADESATEPSPECRFADRTDRWKVHELADVDELDKCACCDGNDGGGYGGGMTPCPFCGEETHATRWPDHIAECNG